MTGEWRKSEGPKLMFEPYPHIVITHVAILFGAGLTKIFENAWPILALIVVGKLILDLRNLKKADPSAPKKSVGN